MFARIRRSPVWILPTLGLILCACQSSSPHTAEESLSLLDKQLIEVLEKEEALEFAANKPEANEHDVHRLFQKVAQEYRGIIARNPRHLESRLLFGKLLSRYGDSEGARDQFLMAANIDPNVAVIHQQLSTYYAEEGDYTRALAYALNALEIEPDEPVYHFGLGQVLAAYRAEFIEDEVYTAKQLDSDMLNAFAQAQRLDPNSIDLAFRYGEAFYDVAAPDWETALAHWQSVIIRPGLPIVKRDATRLHQIRCLIELQRLTEAKLLINAIQTPTFKDSAKLLF